MMPDIKSISLLHISDLHIADKRQRLGSKSEMDIQSLEQIAYFAFQKKDKFDAIAISGDLSDNGDPSAFKIVRDFLFAEPDPNDDRKWIATNKLGTLKACEKSVYFLPGNHDRFKIGTKKNPGSTEFDKAFPDHWTTGIGGIEVFRVPNSSGDFKLAIICADFTLKSKKDARFPFGYIARGKVYQERLDRLWKVTEEIFLEENLPVIWMTHFVPESKKTLRYIQDTRPLMKLVNEERLTKAAKKLCIPIILCGHTHINGVHNISKKSRNEVGRPIIQVAATASANNTIDNIKGVEKVLHIIKFKFNNEKLLSIQIDDHDYTSIGFSEKPTQSQKINFC